MRLKLNEIVQFVEGKLNQNNEDIEIIGVSTDSRKIETNQLFVPLIGENFDGHQFIQTAIEKGATATLWKRSIPYPNELNKSIPVILVDDTLVALQRLAKEYKNMVQPIVVGVTGSNGKTTTKDLIASILRQKYKVHKTIGNLNNHIGLPLTLLSMPFDTEVAVLEMGMSNKGEIELLTNIAQPDIAVITNIGESHIEYLKTRENIALAKLEIVKGLKEQGLLIANGDEPLLRNLVGGNGHFQIKWIGNGEKNQSYPVEKKLLDSEKMFFTTSDGADYVLPLLGNHNVINAMLAIEVGKKLNIDVPTIKKGLEELQITGMRLEKQVAKNGALLLNDAYNASPTSMKASLELLASFPNTLKKVAILGDMLELGKQEKEYHNEIGRLCASLNIDHLITTGTLGKEIFRGALNANLDDQDATHLPIEDISDFVLHHFDQNTVILVKASRGVHLERVVETII